MRKTKTTRAVLVAISIPIFSTQLEKAREATDAANIRSAYAEVVADSLSAKTTDTADITKTVQLKQQQDGWQNEPDFTGALKEAMDNATGTPGKDGTCTITYTPSTQAWSVAFAAA